MFVTRKRLRRELERIAKEMAGMTIEAGKQIGELQTKLQNVCKHEDGWEFLDTNFKVTERYMGCVLSRFNMPSCRICGKVDDVTEEEAIQIRIDQASINLKRDIAKKKDELAKLVGKKSRDPNIREAIKTAGVTK